ncbi:MAG: hypothetical protein AAF413_00180 [Patescibacteria group bacterium]
MGIFRGDNQDDGYEPDALAPDAAETPDNTHHTAEAEQAQLANILAENGVYDAEDQGSFYTGPIAEAEDEAAASTEETSNDDLESGRLGSFYQAAAARTSPSKGKIFGALGLFVAPYLFLLPLLFTPGFDLEHINRLTTAFRFGHFHTQLGKRVNHLANFQIAYTAGGADYIEGRNIPNYERTTMFQRMVGSDAKSVWDKYGDRFTPVYERRATTLGLRRLTSITDEVTGITYSTRRTPDLRALEQLTASLDPTDAQVGVLRTRPEISLFARNNGVPFSRFALIVSKLRENHPDVDTRQKVRAEATKERRNATKPRATTFQTLAGAGQEELSDGFVEQIESGESPGRARQWLADNLEFNKKVLLNTGRLSVAVGLGTIACVFRDAADTIEQGIVDRTRGLMVQASDTETNVSQNRLGLNPAEIAAVLSSDFDGHVRSAAWAASMKGVPVEETDPDFNFSNLFNFKNYLGISVRTVLEFDRAIDFAIDNIPSNPAEVLTDIGEAIPVVGSPFGLIDNSFDSLKRRAADEGCKHILNPGVQIGLTVVELVGTVILTFFTGPLAGTAKGGAGAVISQIARSVATTRAAVSLGASIGADWLIYNWIIPRAIEQSTGISTTYLPGEGARNVEILLEGSRLNAESVSLTSGGTITSSEVALAASFDHMHKYRESFTDRGLASNLFDLDNPYSGASSLASSIPSSVKDGGQSVASLASSVFSGSALMSIFGGSASAQTQNRDFRNNGQAYIDLLYAGSSFGVGFNEQEMTGEDLDFDHVINSDYVEADLPILLEEYGKCITVNYHDLVLVESGVIRDDERKKELGYPEECYDRDARRLLIYWSDCNTAVSLREVSQLRSAFYSTECAQDLAPELLTAAPVNEEDYRYNTAPYRLLAAAQDKEAKERTFTQKIGAELRELHQTSLDMRGDVYAATDEPAIASRRSTLL